MEIYKEIVDWASDKPLFIRDAIRRLFAKSDLDNTDVTMLISLVKKECGLIDDNIDAQPVSYDDIPQSFSRDERNIRIVSIENPVNINALYHKTKLNFSLDGLTLIYGNNGSGKSSIVRILKKLCWSRDKNVVLKPNIYNNDKTKQSVSVTLNDKINGATIFKWDDGQEIIPDLNSIYLFDSKCASIYLNNENITEYKPPGIDVLEKIVKVCKQMNEHFENEVEILNTEKPILEYPKFASSKYYDWYSKIEEKEKQEIDSFIVFPDNKSERKNELISILRQTNPVEMNITLQQKIERFKLIKNSFLSIEDYFSDENRCKVEELKKSYVTKYDVYQIAQKEFASDDPLNGVGSDTWRELWEAAKKYATTEIHPDIKEFPSDKSEEICVLCQQSLSPNAKMRLARFNSFIKDKTSSEYEAAKKSIDSKVKEINDLQIDRDETFREIALEIPEFAKEIISFRDELEKIKKSYADYLCDKKNELSTEDTLPGLSSIVEKRIYEITSKIDDNNKLISDRSILENELVDLEALSFLFNNKIQIIKYHDEIAKKKLLKDCISKTNARAISLKIGEILSSDAIELQHKEFIKHLDDLNSSIAKKVSIKKTKTSSGITYQRCGFNAISENLSDIFSEGEQKIIALANFLSECTIDNKKNTIVFDDPISSFDQNYREVIANKIVNLSKDHQIIVFTHDLYFLRSTIDLYKEKIGKDCLVLGLTDNNGFSGIPSDEIPYLAKNIDERIDTIRKILGRIKSLDTLYVEEKQALLIEIRLKMRQLLERSIEDILINRTVERFSKNIHVKKSNLVSMIVIEESDTNFILSLYKKYSPPVHDGGVEDIHSIPNETTVEKDITSFIDWKNKFKEKLKDYKKNNGYN